MKGNGSHALYAAWHEHAIHDPEYGRVDFRRLIGVYSSQESVEAAVERARGLPGFRASRYNGRLPEEDTFIIDTCTAGEVHRGEGFIGMDD